MVLRRMKCARLWALMGLFVAALALNGCGRAPESAPSPDPPRTAQPRIVVLSPAIGVMLTDLGLAGDVVGRHGWDTTLDQRLPVCGDQTSLDYEALLRARPTHVLTEWGTREMPARFISLAAERGWVTRDFTLLSLGDIESASVALREMFPRAVPDDSIERFDSLMEEPIPDPVWQGRVLLLMGTSPIAAIGPGSAHHELLLRAGGVPAIVEGSPFMPLHAEDVLRLAPDAIILVQPGGAAIDTNAAVSLGDLASLDIPAIGQGRVVRIDHPQALLPSTRLVLVAGAMERALRTWADD